MLLAILGSVNAYTQDMETWTKNIKRGGGGAMLGRTTKEKDIEVTFSVESKDSDKCRVCCFERYPHYWNNY